MTTSMAPQAPFLVAAIRRVHPWLVPDPVPAPDAVLAAFADDTELSEFVGAMPSGDLWSEADRVGTLSRLYTPSNPTAWLETARSGQLPPSDAAVSDWTQRLTDRQRGDLREVALLDAELLGDRLEDLIVKLDPTDERIVASIHSCALRRETIASWLDLLSSEEARLISSAIERADKLGRAVVAGMPFLQPQSATIRFRRARSTDPEAWWVDAWEWGD